MTLKLGVVQARSRPGRTVINLARATRYVEQAAVRGAALVVLPELYACGYLPNRDVWTVAEPEVNGSTASWLTATTKRLGIHLGAATAQTDGTDIFNVFLLARPDGTIAGRAYKTNAEAYVLHPARDPGPAE